MNPYLFGGLECGPAIIGRLLRLIPRQRWDEALEPGRFNPREVAAHLSDWEPILLGRMQASRGTPGATLQGIDESVRADEQGYRAMDPIEQAGRFAERRQATIDWLRMLGPDDWSKHGVHSERGRQTIYDQANMLLGHDLYHIEQLAAYL